MATKKGAAEMEGSTEPSMQELKVLQNNTNPNWLKDKGLRQLNLGIVFMYCTASSAGYIGNLVNSLLVLPVCKYNMYPDRATPALTVTQLMPP